MQRVDHTSTALFYNRLIPGMKYLLRLCAPCVVDAFPWAKLVRPDYRVAVAALIFDEQGRVLLFKHTYRN